MASNSKMTNKQAKAALDKFKYEVANDVAVKKLFIKNNIFTSYSYFIFYYIHINLPFYFFY